MKKGFVGVLVLVFLCVSGVAFAQDEKFELSLERNTVSPGNFVYLYLAFYGGQDVDAPEIAIDGLRINYVGPSTEVSIVNGRVSQSISHRYMIIPNKSGEYTIGPFTVAHNGKQYETNRVVLKVTDTPSFVPVSNQSAGLPIDSQTQARALVGDSAFLIMDIGKRLVYINEIVPVTVKLYVNRLGMRDIQYPEYSHDGFSSGEFEEPQRRQEMFNGVNYDVLTFKQDLFGIKEGNYILGPAKLKCNILYKKRSERRGMGIFDDDFFKSAFGYQAIPAEFKSKEIPVTILPPPDENRPADFRGAVGNFDMTVEVKPEKVKVGDPITLKMTIAGEGNLDTITMPGLVSDDNFKTYESQVTKKAGKKTYEQILIPKTGSIKAIPAVSFSFFDSKAVKYKTIQNGPFPIEVIDQPASEGGVKMVSMPESREIFYPREELGRDIVYIKENIGHLYPKGYSLYGDWRFWLNNGLVLVFFSIFRGVYAKRQRILTDKTYARFLRAPKSARKNISKAKACMDKKDIQEFYDVIFKTLQDYLSGRFGLAKGNIAKEAIKDKLGESASDKKILDTLGVVFSKCEMARYASFVFDAAEAEKILDSVKKIIDYMEKVK
ncbi:MAG: BatD family protein [Candidatus Omnitrophota bacterium]